MCTTDYTIDTSGQIVTAAGAFRVRVESDPYHDNPRDDEGNLGTWVSWNERRWRTVLPHEGDLTGRIMEAYDRVGPSLAVRYLSTVHNAVVLPVHGGRNEYDRAAAGQLGERVDDGAGITGVIYAKRADVGKEWAGHAMPSDEDIARWLRNEVEQYATWAAGEMTDYVLERATCGENSSDHSEHGCECWATVDTCGGYFSSEDAMAAGRDAVPTALMPGDLEALDALNSARRACDLADTQALASETHGPFGLVMRAFLSAATAVLGTRYMAVQLLDLLIGTGESVSYCLDYLTHEPDHEPEWITPRTYE